VRGTARVGGTDYRFRIHQYGGTGYREVNQTAVDTSLPVLFKPMGSPRPDPVYIASDADYVDYITELMRGFAIPDFLKRYRRSRRYLFLGLRLLRDTERMVMADMVYGAGIPTGYALIPEPTGKELPFCRNKGIDVIKANLDDLLAATDHAQGGSREPELLGGGQQWGRWPRPHGAPAGEGLDAQGVRAV
jgi:hypothetical protein